MEVLSLAFVLGPMLFYVFWETESQYILPYHPFLTPIAACGWKNVGEAVAGRLVVARGDKAGRTSK